MKNTIAIVIFLFTSNLLAQNLVFKHFRYDSGMAMRWYPANKSVWQSISKNKFAVIRYEMLDDGNINNKATPVQFE
ncbi:MAG: hypothetical protein IT244_03245, partial [Bacteroidia bacterium]|nr:hypothetical protein [Bacteroidia bacterium]